MINVITQIHICGLLLVFCYAAIEEDLVTSLPLISFTPNFKQYSGYLSVGDKNQRRLHYWFVESSNDPINDPLVLWLNGGPGCSSMEGLLAENGPFKFSQDGESVMYNKFSWNTIANVLYLEAPAGVGFSYSLDNNYTTSDNQTASDNFMALLMFMKYFPEYEKNPLFITGESYGGVYVPTLSRLLSLSGLFNIKGFAVGNGLSSYAINTNSLVFFSYYHGLIGQRLWDTLVHYCCKNGVPNECNFADNLDESCNNGMQEFEKLIEGLNIYNMYDECYPTGRSQNVGANNSSSMHSDFNPKFLMFGLKYNVQNSYKHSLESRQKLSETPPCVNAAPLTNYMNRADVQKAIHVKTDVPHWEVCSNRINYIRQYMDMTDVYRDILSRTNLRFVIYNGDIDMACNYLGDEWFVDSLSQKLVDPWKQWYCKAADGTEQIAGYVKQFERVKFVTIRGAGHMVPNDKPRPALSLFGKFLRDESY